MLINIIGPKPNPIKSYFFKSRGRCN